MGIFKKLFSSGDNENRQVEENVVERNDAAIAAIALALDEFFAEEAAPCCNSMMQRPASGALNPWCLKAYGLRNELANRNPWIQKIHFQHNALCPKK